MYRSNVKKKTGSIRVLSVSEESDVSSVGLSEGEYIVEKVVDVRLVKGKFEYKIRWEGYGAEDDTWEPENTLEREGVKLILAEFKESNAKKIQELQNRRAGNRNARKRAVKYEYVTVPVNSENETLTKFYGENVTREKKSLYDPNHKYTESEKLLSSLGHIQRISRHKMREMVGVSESAPSLANYTIPKKKKITEPVKRSKPSPIFPPIDDTPLVIDEAGSSSKHSSDARDFVDEIGLLDDYRREISPPASPPMEKVEDIPLPKENNNAKSCPLARESKSMENVSLKKQPEHKTKPALLPPVRRFVVPELASELSEEKDRKSSKNSPLRDDMHNRLINMPPRYFPREHYIRNGVRRPMAPARNETRLPARDEFIAIVKSMDSAKLIQIRNSFGHRQFTNLCTGSLDSLQLNILHWLPLEGGCRGEKHPADEIAWIIGNACGAALFRQVDVFGRAPLHYAVLHKKLCLVDIYIKLGSPINMRDKNGQTALMMAISQNQGRIAYLLLNAGGSFNDLYFADDHSECSRLVKSHEQRVELALQIDNGQAMLRDPLRVSPIFVTSLLDGPEFLFQFTLPDFPPLRSRDHTTVLVVCCIGKDGIKWTTQSYPRLRMMQVPYVSGSPVMDFPNTPMIYPCKVSAPLNDIYIRLAPETSRPHVMLACYICTGIYQYPHPVISR